MYRPPSGPCLCGATDCPSCGPAQGYTRLDEETFDEETFDEELAALVRQKGQNLAAITAAQGEFTNEDFAHIDALIFQAFDSERGVGGIPPEAMQAIGQYILTAITRIFTEQAQKELT